MILILHFIPIIACSFFGIDLQPDQSRCFSQLQSEFKELNIEAVSNTTGMEISIHKRFTKAGTIY